MHHASYPCSPSACILKLVSGNEKGNIENLVYICRNELFKIIIFVFLGTLEQTKRSLWPSTLTPVREQTMRWTSWNIYKHSSPWSLRTVVTLLFTWHHQWTPR